MKVNYHPETDSLYIDLSEVTSVESREISEGVVLDYDAAGNLVGIDIDQVVFSHVATALGGALTALDRNDPDVRRAILALRAECTVAKEQLSADGEATVNVVAPGLNTQVRITRDELESALRVCRSEAKAAFGDDSLYLEKWLDENPA